MFTELLWLALCLLTSLPVAASTLAYRAATEVDGDRSIGHAPAPTARAAAAAESLNFVQREAITYNTCGFVDADASEAIVCPRGSVCNTANPVRIAGCCGDYYSSPDYFPYGCTLHTACYDSAFHTQASGTTRATSSGKNDYLDALQCAGASEYCVTYTFTENSHFMFDCGPTRTIIALALSASSTTAQTTNFAVTTQQDTVTIQSSNTITSTVNESLTTTGNETVSQTATGPSESASGRSTSNTSANNKSSTGAIVGGALGGSAIAAAVALAVLLWRHKQKQKETTPPLAPSFKVLSRSMKGHGNGNNSPAGSAPVSVPNPHTNGVEVGNNVAHSRAPSELAVPPSQPVSMYQPYRPAHESPMATALFDNLNHQGTSPQSSFQQSNHYPSYASLEAIPPVPEVHGHSAENIRATTPPSLGGGRSKFSELDAPHMSMQSGPVWEWNY